MNNTASQYIIRINSEGYFGARPYTPTVRNEATVFLNMKTARKQLNRLRGRLGYKNAEIEPVKLN